MAKLTQEQILAIPELVKNGKTIKQIAEDYHTHRRTIDRWVMMMRKEGHEIITKSGARAIKLK